MNSQQFLLFKNLSRKESQLLHRLPICVRVLEDKNLQHLCYRVKKWNLKRKQDIDKIVHCLCDEAQQFILRPTLNIPTTVYKAHLSQLF